MRSDVRYTQVGNLRHAQAGAVGDPERGLVLGTWCGLDQPRHLLQRQNHGQLLRLAHQRQMACHLRPVAGLREEKPQGRDRAVHRRRLHALLTLMHLIEAQIFRLRLIRRAAEEECEVLDWRI